VAKMLFVVMDDPSNLESSIRAAHAFHYAVSLSKAGHEVKVYLDGLALRYRSRTPPTGA